MEDKYKAQKKYDKENTLRTNIKLNRKTDADIIEFLENSGNKQGVIKEAIRVYIKSIE